jgi:FKBP-type peptidyl-prolyl cis-trans isomerase SlyD
MNPWDSAAFLCSVETAVTVIETRFRVPASNAVSCHRTHMRKERAMHNTVTNGKVISLEYTLKLEDGQVVDTNVGADPLTYTHGSNQIIPGVESAVEGMEVGQAKQAVVPPTQGYGDADPNAFAEMPKDKLPREIEVGTQLHGKDASGREIRPIVSAIRDETVLLDFNHPLAGKTLYFDLKVVNIT